MLSSGGSIILFKTIPDSLDEGFLQVRDHLIVVRKTKAAGEYVGTVHRGAREPNFFLETGHKTTTTFGVIPAVLGQGDHRHARSDWMLNNFGQI